MGFRTQIQTLRPIAASQILTFSGSSSESSAMPAGTKVVRVVANQDCYIQFTKTTVTPATNTSMFLGGTKSAEYFDISSGEVIAALQVTTGGQLYITPMGK